MFFMCITVYVGSCQQVNEYNGQVHREDRKQPLSVSIQNTISFEMRSLTDLKFVN